MSPGIEDVRVARREALPHLRKEVRILPTNGSAPWRAIPSYPEGDKETAHPAPQRNRAAELCQSTYLGCLKIEYAIRHGWLLGTAHYACGGTGTAGGTRAFYGCDRRGGPSFFSGPKRRRWHTP